MILKEKLIENYIFFNAKERLNGMKNELEYSAALTGASFLLYEFKQIVRLKDQGLTDKEIRTKVIKENLFQYEKLSSIQRGLPSLLRRVHTLDDILRKYVLEESLEVVKVINLYAIMKTDRLFFEFMNEVIKEKLETNNYLFEKKDLNTYFTVKVEQHEDIAQWTEKTIQKLKQVYHKILLETGMLQHKGSVELNRIYIDNQLKRYLIELGDAPFVQAMGA